MSSLPDRSLGTPPSRRDDGSPDPRVIAALDAYANGTGGSADVQAALATGRLLVPVVAVLDEPGESPDGVRTDNVRRDKASHMATVSTTGRDGRRGLLAFTSTESMRQWNAAARPVPVTTRRAAEAALADGADALVIDLAGPVTFSVDAGELRALAAGWRPVGDERGGTTWAVAVGLAGQADVEQPSRPGQRPARAMPVRAMPVRKVAAVLRTSLLRIVRRTSRKIGRLGG